MSGGQSWGVVIVNYNSARFALDAALSVLGVNPGARVVIIDNASTNNSVEIFEKAIHEGVHNSHYPNNPVTGLDLNLAAMNAVSSGFFEEDQSPGDPPSLSIVKARNNRGFAAGCNMGLRFLGEAGDSSHFLLLNPDALLGAGALDAFAHALSAPGAGLCGATVLLANQPGRVQAFGGARLNPISLTGENIGHGELLFSAPATEDAEAQLSYPLGAAIALKADYLAAAGYMDERYFLYYEEADWALAGRKFGRTVWARDAFIFHHYGVSSQSEFPVQDQPSRRSPLAEYHMARSRFLFALKWRPWLAPLMLLIGAGQVLLRLARGQFQSAAALARGATPGAARIYQP